MVIGEIFARNARRYPERERVIYQDTRLTFRELNERVNRLTRALVHLGVQKQDRIALIANNCHQFIEIIGACAKGGFILASLSTKLKDELSHILGNARPRLVIAGADYLDKIRPEWDFIKNVICLGHGPGGVLSYEELIADFPPEETGNTVGEEDILLLYYTSGTTSLPKGAALSHRALLANIVNQIINFGLKPGSRNVVVHPLFFTAPVNCTVLPMMYLGCPTVILEGFDPENFLSTVEREKITHVIVVPTMVVRLLDSPSIGRYDLSSLEMVLYGSAAMPVSRLKEALQRFGPIFAQGYGLTETICAATCLRPEEHFLGGTPEEVRRLASCGREGVNRPVRVVRSYGTDVARDGRELGEIIIRGDNLMTSYWNMPDVTAETIRDGWLYSGDLAAIDCDGYIYIVDRKKDMLISGGINIYPREIEEVLYRYPAIYEAAVIGIADEEWGEKVTAVVVLKEGQTLKASELIEYCREHLATYKKPKEVIFDPSLPKTPTGKILKRELKM
jgi:acyl-CoA synthetase (AMP-forming)/AMP-acid ligase II